VRLPLRTLSTPRSRLHTIPNHTINSVIGISEATPRLEKASYAMMTNDTSVVPGYLNASDPIRNVVVALSGKVSLSSMFL